MALRSEKFEALRAVARSRGEKPALELLPHLFEGGEEMQAPLVRPDFVDLMCSTPQAMQILRSKSPSFRALVTSPQAVELFKAAPEFIDVVGRLRFMEYGGNNYAQLLIEQLQDEGKRKFALDKGLGKRFMEWFSSKNQALVEIAVQKLVEGDTTKIDSMLMHGADAVRKELALHAVEQLKVESFTPLSTTVPLSTFDFKGMRFSRSLAGWIDAIEEYSSGKLSGGYDGWRNAIVVESPETSQDTVEKLDLRTEAAYRNMLGLRVLFSRDRDRLRADLKHFSDMLHPDALTQVDGLRNVTDELLRIGSARSYTSDEKLFMAHGVYSTARRLSDAGFIDASTEDAGLMLGVASRIIIGETVARHLYGSKCSFNTVQGSIRVLRDKLNAMGLQELERHVAEIEVNSTSAGIKKEFARRLMVGLFSKEPKPVVEDYIIPAENGNSESAALRAIEKARKGDLSGVREMSVITLKPKTSGVPGLTDYPLFADIQSTSSCVLAFGDGTQPATIHGLLSSLAENPDLSVSIVRVNDIQNFASRMMSAHSYIRENRFDQLEAFVNTLSDELNSGRVKPLHLNEYRAYFSLVFSGLVDKLNKGYVHPDVLRIGGLVSRHLDEMDIRILMYEKQRRRFEDVFSDNCKQADLNPKDRDGVVEVVKQASKGDKAVAENIFKSLCLAKPEHLQGFSFRLKRLDRVGGTEEQKVGVLEDVLSICETDRKQELLGNSHMPSGGVWMGLPKPLSKSPELVQRFIRIADGMTPEEHHDLLAFLSSKNKMPTCVELAERLENLGTTPEGWRVTPNDTTAYFPIVEAIRDGIHLIDTMPYPEKEELIERVRTLSGEAMSRLSNAALSLNHGEGIPSELALLIFQDIIHLELSNPDQAQQLGGFMLPYLTIASGYMSLASEFSQLNASDKSFYDKAGELRDRAASLSTSMKHESEQKEFKDVLEGVVSGAIQLPAQESRVMADHVENFGLMRGDCNMVLVDFLNEVLELGGVDPKLGRKYFDTFLGDRMLFYVKWDRSKVSNQARRKDEG